MEMLLGFIVLLACLIIGVQHGGIGLAAVSGVGLVIFTFVFGYKPGNPPIGVMLTILAVVTCAGFLQTSGGLTVMLKYAFRSYDDMVPYRALRYWPRCLHDVPDHL